MKRVLLSLIYFALITPLIAQTIVWDSNNESLNIGDKVYTLEDKEGLLTIDQVSTEKFADKFILSKKNVLNAGITTAYQWIRFSFENNTNDKLVLEIAQPFLPYTDLYYKDTSGVWQSMKAGYKVDLNEKIIRHHYQLFPLQNGKHEFYVRYLAYSHSVPIKIWKNNVYEIKSNIQKLIYGLYVGILLFVIINNLFLFFSFRNWTYLHYAILVLGYTFIAACVMDGYVLYISPHVDMIFWYILLPVINMPIAMSYCVSFLEIKKYSKKLFRICGIFIVYFVLNIIAHIFLPLNVVLVLNPINALLLFLLITTVSIRTGIRGNKFGYYFAWTYFIWFVIVLVETIYDQTGFPPYYFEVSHVSVAIFIEIFLLSFLLTKRFEEEKMEIENAKAAAQLLVIEKTKENEKIVLEQNIVLEQKVTERTHQLKEANAELNTSLENVEIERQKSEKLLHNILPEEVADELKQKGSAEAKQYDYVSVLFTDFVNFTGISEMLSPKDLVAEIDLCFRAFDEIMEQNGLEKIKTIGDSYLAVCGLPNIDYDHAKKAVSAALAIQHFMAERKKALGAKNGLVDIRIGIHSGPVVAGIVGSKKFAYDIWGDTVNTASRMESNSKAGKINISGTTYHLVKDDYKCSHRGKIEAENKGMIDMYFVE